MVVLFFRSGFDPVDLSTGLAALTTCKSSICLTTCKGVRFARIRGGGGSLCTYFHGKRGFALHVENSAESHKPVEIGDLRAQGASGEWERLEILERASGAVTGR